MNRSASSPGTSNALINVSGSATAPLRLLCRPAAAVSSLSPSRAPRLQASGFDLTSSAIRRGDPRGNEQQGERERGQQYEAGEQQRRVGGRQAHQVGGVEGQVG